MSTNATHEFPSLVGGVPLPVDFAPSILFACLYAVMLPVVFWRIIHPRSRSAALAGTTFFSIERVVAYALRAKASHDLGSRMSKGLETYLQVTYAGGFITIGQDLANVTRSLLVAYTLGGDMLAKHKLTPQISKGGSSFEMQEPFATLPEGRFDTGGQGDPAITDHPRTRYWIRQMSGIWALLFLVTIILSAIAGADYKEAIATGADAALVRWLRYVSTGLAIILLHGVGGLAVWAYFYMPRVPRSSVVWIVLVASLLSVVGIYRVDTMFHNTTSLTSTAPGSLTSNLSKAGFYVFHVAPEFLAVAILMSLNTRRVFATGMWGDWRISDPKPQNNYPSNTSSTSRLNSLPQFLWRLPLVGFLLRTCRATP
ncbi:hypothetical protein BD309DRAFT_923309 [Dichomitus squalens]|nr:hypothetical protein BD309DRAFT_923309 [Dichomitus squalens]